MFISRFLLMVFISSILVACVPNEKENTHLFLRPTATAYVGETAVTLPEYLYDVWPASSQSVSERRSTDWLVRFFQPCNMPVSVEIWPDKIYSAKFLAENEATAHQSILDEITLAINDLVVPNSDIEIHSGINGGIYIDETGKKHIYDAGPYKYLWHTRLCAGQYDVLLEIGDFENNTLSYSWSFAVISE